MLRVKCSLHITGKREHLDVWLSSGCERVYVKFLNSNYTKLHLIVGFSRPC